MDNANTQNTNTQTIVVAHQKSVAVSLILTFLFGSLGMLYSTVIGAIIMIIVEFIVLLVTIATLGIGVVLFFFTHIICMIWGAVAVNKRNKELLGR